MLGDSGEDVHREPVGLREVDGDEVDSALHQVRDEGDVARQPIESWRSPASRREAAGGERLLELGRSPCLPLSTSMNSATRLHGRR